MMLRMKRGAILGIVLGALVVHIVSAQKQDGTRNAATDWPTYNRDLAGTRYSSLTQINTKNVSTLVQACLLYTSPSPRDS